MTIFKCKMCGGDLEITPGSTVCECEYCGTTQTVPTADNDKKMNLFNRANRLRFANEFDKAAGVFESIVSEFPEEAEAYWGLCLCKYGIEYVDDPATAKKIPTCHRTSYDSIFDDSNFDMAQEYADVVARKVYRDEAKEIDRLQKSILEIAKNEEPFDIFICYKETGNDGQRTIDSVLAQDIYDNLTEKGYKVFFARITLEDKLGQEYEPYIFSALSSAKVMLVIGTDYEYFNAVWVKNEWSRFLDMMKTDKKKTLIPCYKDIDAYDIPGEFRHLQAQDMGKVGFMQDLVRGIGKIIPLQSQMSYNRAAYNGVIVQQTAQSGSVDSLLKRAFMFLEDGDFASANNYADKVLDLDPECAKAYVVKLLADRKIRTQEALHFSKSKKPERLFNDPIEKNKNYKKALRFADHDLKRELEKDTSDNAEENDRRRYEVAKAAMESAVTYEDFNGVAKQFDKISYYKDSAQLAKQCKEKVTEIVYKLKEAYEALKAFGKVGDIIPFGDYDWYIIDETLTGVTLLCKGMVDQKAYNEIATYITWEECTLRKWLNEDFYNSFTDDEKMLIAMTKCENKGNSKYGTKDGNDTEDYVFLLSVDEDEALDESIRSLGEWSWWWLRSQSWLDNDVYWAMTDDCGSLLEEHVDSVNPVRPALNLRFESSDPEYLRNLRQILEHNKEERDELRRQEEQRQQEEEQRNQRINTLTNSISSTRAEITDLDSTLSSLRTNLQQQQSIYTANAGKLFGKKKAEAAQAEINRINGEISRAEQKKAELEAQLAKLEAELKELEAQS